MVINFLWEGGGDNYIIIFCIKIGGIAIHNSISIFLERVTLFNNTAIEGGAIQLLQTSVIFIFNSNITSNKAVIKLYN